MIEAVLFDLDGTLIDTAPDMGGALNNLLIEENYPALPLETIRPFVSQGGLVLTRLGFAERVDAAEIEPLRQRFLQHYRQIVADNSRLFDGCATVLDRLESRGIRWGIVTNKPELYTTPVMQGLALQPEAGSVICPDHVHERKPHPEALYLACSELNTDPLRCVYVGDHRRDIEAGQRAGMKTIAVSYGYIDEDEDIHSWESDYLVDHASEIRPLLETIFCNS